jgi:hypothetical protein
MVSQQRVNILLSLGVAFLLSLVLYFGIILFFVNPHLETSEKLPNIFNLYAEKTGDPSSKVYILGSSQVREGVNATIIQELWGELNIHYEVYNMGYTGDTPLRRLTELQAMEKSHPKIVIIGVSYQSFFDGGSIPYEQLLMVAEKITLDNTSRMLYNPVELHWLSLNFFESSYEKRIWVLPAIRGIVLGENQNILESHNFKDPFIYTTNQTDEELLKKLRDHPDEQQIYISFPQEDNRQKTALVNIIRQLQDSGTRVVIVVMPLNSLLEQTVKDSDRCGMRTFLKDINTSWIDLESEYPQSDFIDFVHMNIAGREKFSRDLAEAIKPD